MLKLEVKRELMYAEYEEAQRYIQYSYPFTLHNTRNVTYTSI